MRNSRTTFSARDARTREFHDCISPRLAAGAPLRVLRELLRKLDLSEDALSVGEAAAIDRIYESGDHVLRWILGAELVLLTVASATAGALPLGIFGLATYAVFLIATVLYPAALAARIAAALVLIILAAPAHRWLLP